MRYSDQHIASTFYAYKNTTIGPGLEAVVRFHSVKRWHMIDTTRQQTLAEHSANVALLVYHISSQCPHMYFGPSGHAATYALLHDLPEVYTGDIPSHTKGFIDGIAELEVAVTPDYMVPKSTVGVTSHGLNALTKLCDLADGIRFIRLHGVGATAKHAEAGLAGKFAAAITRAKDDWPAEVSDYVSKQVMLYAYEYS